MQTVAIAGVGLIGASFGLGLRRAGFKGPILGVSSPGAISDGLAVGAISEPASLDEAAERADLIYLSQPVDRILETIQQLGPVLRPGCLVTDAGSTKAAIVAKASQSLPPNAFLGGHPMAGKEQRGAAAAEATLFRERPYVLTPSGELSASMLEFRDWLDRMEACTLLMSATEHDSVVALTSHLPQLLSMAICLTLANQRNPDVFRVFGPGLLDMTRLAMSSPELWESILLTNRAEIIRALEAFTQQAAELTSTLESAENLDHLFNQARDFSMTLRKLSNPKSRGM